MKELTPYDTGAALEPKSWIPYGTEVTDATPAENFGKVDFDDDTAETEMVIQVLKAEDGSCTVHITPLGEAIPAVVIHHE